MNCIKCNMPLENVYICPHCGHVDKVAKKIIYSSNWHYNQGLAKAKVRDLSGAVTSLSQSLKYNKRNTDARNLLGLIYRNATILRLTIFRPFRTIRPS